MARKGTTLFFRVPCASTSSPRVPPSPSQLDWLYGTQLFGIKLGLEGIARLLDACGVARPCAAVVHVAGTNGKGSTCAMIASMAQAAGYRTGLFTSPHLVRFNERIRVQGREIPDEEIERCLTRIRTLIEGWATPPTFFEIVLALAMMHFAEEGVEIIVLETGMGGRLDATNAVPKDVAVLTPIGMDHAQYLGATLDAVAAEKAGIIARGRPVVSAAQQPEARRVLDAAARRMETRVVYSEGEIDWPCALRGRHQRENACVAVAALKALAESRGLAFPADAMAAGLASVAWPGRFEEILPNIVMDGAHNPHAMRRLAETWRAERGDARALCLFAASADKDIEGMLALLAPLVAEWILPPVDSPRILPPKDMAERVAAASDAPVACAPTLRAALDAAVPGSLPVLICGSFFLLGEARALLERADYRPTMQ